MRYELNGKEVEIEQVHLEVGEGVWVEEASWVDTGMPLTDDELDEIADKYQSKLYENAYSSMLDHAHSSMEDR